MTATASSRLEDGCAEARLKGRVHAVLFAAKSIEDVKGCAEAWLKGRMHG